MPRIIVTGATSMIGRHFCEEMLRRGWEVYAIHRKPAAELPDGVHSIRLDMSEYCTLSEMLPACDIGVTFAWNGTRGRLRLDPELQQKNYLFTMDGIRSMLELGCKTIVTAGSQAEYGPQHSENKVSEATPLQPDTAYGFQKKHVFEDALRLCEAHHVRLLEPRFYSVFGPGDYADGLVASTLRKMLQNEACDLTACVQLWDFLYVKDAAAMLADLIVSDAESGAYNFGAGNTARLKNFVYEMKRQTHSQSELCFGAIEYNGEVCHLNPDVTKLFSTIGARRLVSFQQGVACILSDMSAL